MGSTRTDVLTPKQPMRLWPRYGRSILVVPGDRLLKWSARRGTLGLVYRVGIPHHDPYLGEYITEIDAQYEIAAAAVDVIEHAPVIG